MKTLLILILLSLPTMSSAAEYLYVECYIAEGTNVTKTFEGYVHGTVKSTNNRVVVEGKNIETHSVHRTGTPDTCKAPTQQEYDQDSGYYTSKVENVQVYEFDYSMIDISCAQGSVVKRYGNLANFTKAIEAQLRRITYTGNKPACLDVTGLE